MSWKENFNQWILPPLLRGSRTIGLLLIEPFGIAVLLSSCVVLVTVNAFPIKLPPLPKVSVKSAKLYHDQVINPKPVRVEYFTKEEYLKKEQQDGNVADSSMVRGSKSLRDRSSERASASVHDKKKLRRKHSRSKKAHRTSWIHTRQDHL